MDKLLDVKEVADILQLTENTVRMYIRKKKLNAVRFGQVYRVDLESLRRFVSERFTVEEVKR